MTQLSNFLAVGWVPEIAGSFGAPATVQVTLGPEPGDPEHYSVQGIYQSNVGPFVGQSRVTSGIRSFESWRDASGLGYHEGEDLVGPDGAKQVKSISGGVCAFAGATAGGGNQVIVQVAPPHPFYLRYLHMAQPSPVSVGQVITPGMLLGIEGATGTVTGAHLHLDAFQLFGASAPEGGGGRKYFDWLPYVCQLLAPPPFASGITLTTFGGGLVDVMEAEAIQHGVISASRTIDGQLVTFVPKAPAFVNQEFVDSFEYDWMPAGTPLLVAKP